MSANGPSCSGIRELQNKCAPPVLTSLDSCLLRTSGSARIVRRVIDVPPGRQQTIARRLTTPRQATAGRFASTSSGDAPVRLPDVNQPTARSACQPCGSVVFWSLPAKRAAITSHVSSVQGGLGGVTVEARRLVLLWRSLRIRVNGRATVAVGMGVLLAGCCPGGRRVHSGVGIRPWGGGCGGGSVDRYIHHQLSAVVEAVCAVAINASVVFGVRGVPRIDADTGWILVIYIASYGVFGVLACTGLKWLGGEKRDFESAVPLANPDTVLPTPGSLSAAASAGASLPSWWCRTWSLRWCGSP